MHTILKCLQKTNHLRARQGHYISHISSARVPVNLLQPVQSKQVNFSQINYPFVTHHLKSLQCTLCWATRICLKNTETCNKHRMALEIMYAICRLKSNNLWSPIAVVRLPSNCGEIVETSPLWTSNVSILFTFWASSYLCAHHFHHVLLPLGSYRPMLARLPQSILMRVHFL